MTAGKRIVVSSLVAAALSGLACLILRLFGLEVLMICGAGFLALLFYLIACFLEAKGKLDTSKIIIFILIYVGVLMAGFSYYLAYRERVEIAESLSKAALVELVAPAVMMLFKALVENLSKNNVWPDKPSKDDEPKI